MRAALPPTALAGLPVAVFGLGDSGYPNFNTAAKKLGARLAGLGGRPLCPPGLGDDQAPAGPDGGLDAWLPGLWPALRRAVPGAPPTGPATPADADCAGAGLGPCRLVVGAALDAASDATAAAAAPPPTLASALAAHAAFSALDAEISGAKGAALPSPPGRPGSSPCVPVAAVVAANVRVTAAAHWQHVAHLTFSLPPASAFAGAAPGDVLAVLPPQDPGAVEAVLARVGLDGGARLRVSSPSSASTSMTATAADLVAGVLALTCTPPRRTCVQCLADWATDEQERERLGYLASPEGRGDWARYAVAERRGLATVLADFPSSSPPLAWLLAAGPRLQPRRFSLASDVGGAHGRGGARAELAVAGVEWVSPGRRRVRGLASAWLAGLPPGASLPVWWERGSLKAPPADVPLILVGPGTGVAPLRALLQRRGAERAAAAAAATGPLPPPATLFFGCRSPAADYYFRADWEALLESGVLDPDTGLNVAFSREAGRERVYVTDLMRSAPVARALWAALQAGAWVFVCGSARKMPGDVAAAFAGVGVIEGGMSDEDAKAWVRGLQAGGRYWVEAWS
jgi:sulfite reductase alpha subunit-like flavoprotein